MKYILALLLCGCGSLQQARATFGVTDAYHATDEECRRYDASYLRWGGIAAGSGALAGVGGFVSTQTNDNTARVAAGTAALALGALAATAVFESTENAKRFTEQCTTK